MIDFLKYILVKDMRIRPTIDNVLKRFEHMYAILVGTSSSNTGFNNIYPGVGDSYLLQSHRSKKVSLTQMLEETTAILTNNGVK